MKRPIERKKTVDQSSKFSPKSLEDWSITLNPNFSFFEMEYFIIKNLHSTKNIFMGKHCYIDSQQLKKQKKVFKECNQNGANKHKL